MSSQDNPKKPVALSPPDAARHIGIADDILTKAMSRKARKGELPGCKVNGRWVFKTEDLDNHLRNA